MANNKTEPIKIINTLSLVFLACLLMLSGCSGPIRTYYQQGKLTRHDEILGGKAVMASTLFAKKVIYLAVGVTWTKTKTGVSVQHQRICSASAISKRVLLTAAHCVAGMAPSQINAVLSLNPFKDDNLIESDWVRVEKILIHANYKANPEVQNDIALVKLSQDLEPSRVSKIASADQTQSEMQIIAIGYGKTRSAETEGENLDSLLHYVMKSVIQFNAADPKIYVEQFDQTGICSGDSGSPGFIYDTSKKEFYTLGISSYVFHPKNKVGEARLAEACHGYGVYMNALVYSDWILDSLKSMQ